MDSQLKIALFTEMIHTASLIHDDIIDNANFRRKNISLSKEFGNLKATMAGNYIMGIAASSLAKLNDSTIISNLSQVINDLVEGNLNICCKKWQGELLQLKNKNQFKCSINDSFEISYLKTASLFANSFKSVKYNKLSK